MRHETEVVFEQCRGAVVRDVDLSSTPTILFEDGRRLKLQLVTDDPCRSDSSFYTDESQFRELIGSTILSIEERSNCEPRAPGPPEDNTEWHFLVFTTDSGHVTIDWRNDSNGFYDGSVWPEFVTEEVETSWRPDTTSALAQKMLSIARGS